MNHPHEQQAAAMDRAGELPDGEQLRECINSGQVSAAQVVAHAEAGEVTTGWPPGMLQDDSRQLSKALSRDPNARALVRDAAIAIERFEPEHDSEGNYMAFYLDGDYVRHSDHITALAAERAEVARLTALLKNIRMVHGEWFGNEISSETAITYIGMYIAEDAATFKPTQGATSHD